MNQIQVQPTIQQNPTGVYQTFQQNQAVVNPADGKQYNIVQQTPGKGVTLTDPQTSQQLMVSEEDSQNLKPALKTSSYPRPKPLESVYTSYDELTKEHGVFGSESGHCYWHGKEEKTANLKVEELNSQRWQGSFESTINAMLDIEKEAGVEEIDKPADISLNNIAREIVAELTGQDLPISEIQCITNQDREIKRQRAHTMFNKWKIARKEQLKTRSQMNPKEISESPTYNEPRQDQAIRELTQTGFLKEAKVFDPYEGDLNKEVGRDRVTGLPMRGGDDIEVGLTEFPYGVDKSKNPEGYGGMTFEQMDNKFENERSHFHNEQLLPSYTMKREESEDYYGGDERRKRIKKLREDNPTPRYSFPESDSYSMNPENVKESALENAIDKELGIVTAAEGEEPTKLPVQYKEVAKAPKLEEFHEPNVLENANPDIKTAIELLKETQSNIKSIQSQIEEKTEPLQKAIFDATKTLNEDLAKNAALLKSTLDMLYSELNKTSDKVAVLDNEIYAAIGREKAQAPSATLPQILKKAEDINPQVAEEIKKIKATLESDNTKMVIEQLLYKYPVSEVQKKKIQAALEDSGDFNAYLSEITSVIESLQELNNTL